MAFGQWNRTSTGSNYTPVFPFSAFIVLPALMTYDRDQNNHIRNYMSRNDTIIKWHNKNIK